MDNEKNCRSATLPPWTWVVKRDKAVNDGLPGDELAQDDQVMSRVAQIGVDPLRRKHLVKCLCYHHRDLCWGCRSTLTSTLSHPLEVKEKCPHREVQRILPWQSKVLLSIWFLRTSKIEILASPIDLISLFSMAWKFDTFQTGRKSRELSTVK